MHAYACKVAKQGPGWVNVPVQGDDYIHYVDRLLRTHLDCWWRYYLCLIHE